jgi:2,4-dienoyl-CoA reductase-like NADH-dependent reductase (Old Yellow Enzyme family)/thioredoxin reductase
MTFPDLFSSIKIGSKTLKNRLVWTAHATIFEERGTFSDRHVHYYAERAKGGVGMIVTEGASVHATATFPLRIHDDSVIPPMARIADAVHEHGTVIVAQITHAGRRVPHPSGVAETVTVAPSAVPAPSVHFGRVMPHELSITEIDEIVAAFGAAAGRVRQAGFDGVEVSIAFGNLIPQFLSPNSNRRTDRYGGSIDGRLTFARECLASVREAIDPDAILGVRYTDDELDYGQDIDDIVAWIPKLCGPELVDYISVTAGTNYDLKSAASIIPSQYYQPGQFAGLASRVKEVAQVPVVGSGRIKSPELADQLVRDGQMDLVGMARELIADAWLPAKAEEGRADEIRPCMACNQSCKGRQARRLPITCVYNPAAGREATLAVWSDGASSPAPDAAIGKSVLVVGGGPAGLEAATVAAERGHRVTLLERSDRTGGQTNVAAMAPGRAEWGDIARYMTARARRAGVDIRTGVEATAETVLTESPDAVVVATGATPYVPEMPGAEGSHVTTAHDAIKGDAPVGDRVVVIDTQGLRAGCDAANHLAKQGKDVTLVTGMPVIGEHVQTGTWRHLYEDLVRAEVNLSPLTEVVAIGENSVSVRDAVYSPKTWTIEGVDTVVFAAGGQARDGLYRELQGRVGELHAIGDCMQPRDVEAAVYEGHMLGRAL